MLTIKDFSAKSKPFQSVWTHSLVSGLTAQTLLREYVSEGILEKLQRTLNWATDETVRFTGYFVALHDIGKLAPYFSWNISEDAMRLKLEAENLDPPIKAGDKHYRHEKTTQVILSQMWIKLGYDRKTAKFLSGILEAHHQGKSEDGESPGYHWKQWEQHHRELERQVRQAFYENAPIRFPAIKKQDQGFLGAVLLGLTILADWIASGESFQDAEDWMNQGNIRTKVDKRLSAFLQVSGLHRQKNLGGERFCEVWPNIPPDGMRPLQRELENLFLQTEERIFLVLLEAPMGEGKTEAGLYAALQMARQWKKAGFYIGLPTSATANQMVGRMRELLAFHGQEEPVRLLHAMAWLVDEETPEDTAINTEDEAAARRWLEPLRRGLLSSYAVGTVDQAMMSALLVKYGVLRLLGLSGKALVIDELHAYDVYMSEILLRLLQWCRALEIPVVLLSATLPPEKKRQLLSPFAIFDADGPYPAISAITESGKLLVSPIAETTRRQQVRILLAPILHEPRRIAEKTVQLVAEGGCACILMNTVRQAQEVYQSLREQETDARLLLFHAQFPAAHREKIEKECLRLFGKDKRCRPQKAILVATQVVEQSLDVDMDVMLTAIAPMDLLLQRTGRMFRHDNTPRPSLITGPVLYVLTPADGNLGPDGFVYLECLLRQSIHLLEGRSQIHIPEDLAELVADGYDMEKASQEDLNAWLERLMEDQISSAQGALNTLGDPKGPFQPIRRQIDFDDLESSSFLSAKTRLGEPAERIALLEADLYAQIEGLTVWKRDRRYAPVSNKLLARRVLEQSVSVPQKRIRGLQGIRGERLLDGVEIFPVEAGTYTAPDGRTIWFDPILGVLWKGGEPS